MSKELQGRLQQRVKRHARHMVVAARVLFTLVAECIALRLRALLPRICRWAKRAGRLHFGFAQHQQIRTSCCRDRQS